MNGKKWTTEEDELCKSLLLEYQDYEIVGKLLNRNKNSIKNRNKLYKIQIRKINHGCKVEGCNGKYHANGYCVKHNRQMSKYNKITDPTSPVPSIDRKKDICEYCGSNHNVSWCKITKQILCNKHYKQILKYGKILERTIKDKNDYEIKTDKLDKYAEIILRNEKQQEIGRTQIDIEDLDRTLKRKWRMDNWRYASSGHSQHKSQEYVTLQNYLLKYNKTIDHIDRNRLNNRKYNLRKSNKKLNARNKSIRSNNTSGIIGVSWNKRDNNWETYISINYKKINLGSYNNINDAIITRLKAEIKYFKEYAPQKHLFEKYNINYIESSEK